mgnify:CR=1 FL=1
MLMSSSGFGGQTKKQERAMAMLQSQSIEPELMDGSDPTNREQQNQLFEMSGMRGNHSQFFLKEQDGKMYFVGDFDTIERCNDAGYLLKEVLMVLWRTIPVTVLTVRRRVLWLEWF